MSRDMSLFPGGRIPIGASGIREVELVELLGSGNFGWVWKATDIDSGQSYCLKIIQHIKPDSIEAERVRLEAEVRIPSKYVVPVVCFLQWDPMTYLILFEYCDATSLDKMLRNTHLTGKEKRHIFKQTLLGVADAHRCSVIHRDLKPANILIERDNSVRLIDFGISKFKGANITVTGNVVGTLPYLAPDLLGEGSKTADTRTDIYSLGQILYELAMGYTFWERKNWRSYADLLAFLDGTPEPTEVMDLSGFHCDFYDNAGKSIMQMTKVRSSERPSSVDDVLSSLGHSPRVPTLPDGLDTGKPLLIVESGTNKNAQTLLIVEDGGSVSLGRLDFAGADTSISRKHVEFSRTGDRYFVRDLGSKNGTALRGMLLKHNGPAVEIRHGDRIKVGEVFLRFVYMRKAGK